MVPRSQAHPLACPPRLPCPSPPCPVFRRCVPLAKAACTLSGFLRQGPAVCFRLAWNLGRPPASASPLNPRGLLSSWQHLRPQAWSLWAALGGVLASWGGARLPAAQAGGAANPGASPASRPCLDPTPERKRDVPARTSRPEARPRGCRLRESPWRSAGGRSGLRVQTRGRASSPRAQRPPPTRVPSALGRARAPPRSGTPAAQGELSRCAGPGDSEQCADREVSMAGQLSATGIFGTRRAEGRGATADWMSGLCPRLWDVPLHLLSLPGSHDTMTYCLNRGSPVSRTQSRLLHFLSKAVPCITQPVVLKWSVTQTLDVSEQLAAGVRYLDLRVAHEPGGSRRNLHFVHMVYTTALVEDTLTEISEWLQQHPREVLVVACRNFEGLGEDLHEYLVTCIKNIFGAALCPRGEVPTLRQLWARGQQVLLSYEDEATVARHPELWPGIPYWWGDQVKSQALIRYLETMKSCGRPGGLFVAGTNLTESLGYILAHPAQSLAKLTLPALPALSAWVREQSPGPGPSCTNIIAGDFIGADTFVTDVIGLNQKLLRG